MENWLVAQCVFAITLFVESTLVVQAQRHEFHVDKSSEIPCCNFVLKWVEKFQNTGSIFDYFVGSSQSAHILENVGRVREATDSSPTHSARCQPH
jgi:hypothetical protein